MGLIKFKCSAEEQRLIGRVAAKAIVVAGKRGTPPDQYYDMAHLSMSLTACHLNGCPLDLEGLLQAEDTALLHDVGGIASNISIKSGKLMRKFMPAYTLGKRLYAENAAAEKAKADQEKAKAEAKETGMRPASKRYRRPGVEYACILLCVQCEISRHTYRNTNLTHGLLRRAINAAKAKGWRSLGRRSTALACPDCAKGVG